MSQPTSTFSKNSARRWRLRPVLAAVLTVFGAAALTACGTVNEEPMPISTHLPTRAADTITFDGKDLKLQVQVLEKNLDRQTAPKIASFGERDGMAHGLLHVYPEGSRAVFRPLPGEVDTEAAFIADSGTIVAVETVAAATRKLADAQRTGVDQAAELPNEGNRLGTASWPGTDVRYVLQVEAGWLSKNAVKVGTVVRVPEAVTKIVAEPALPLMQFKYVADSRGQTSFQTATFNVHLATTPEARDQWLSREGLETLTDSDALLVMWPTERVLQLSGRDLRFEMFVVPVQLPQPHVSTISGPFVPLASPLGLIAGDRSVTRADFLMHGQFWVSGQDHARPTEFISAKAHHGFILFRARAITKLGMRRADHSFGGYSSNFQVEAPSGADSFQFMQSPVNAFLFDELKRAPILDDPPTFSARIGLDGGNAVTVTVRGLSTDADRRHALALVPELKPLTGGPEESAGMEIGFDPRIAKPAADAAAFLLMFDRHRQRPLSAAGLKAPFDLGVFDDTDRLARIVHVTPESPLDTKSLSPERFKFLLVVPRGWFAQNGLQSADTKPVRTHALQLPGSVARQVAEPERVEIFVDGRPVWVELALTPDEVKRGWMWRRQLPTDAGLLMLDNTVTKESVWGYGLFADVAVAHIRADFTVAKIVTVKHPLLPDQPAPQAGATDIRATTVAELRRAAERDYVPGEPVRYRLWMPEGWFRANAIEPGAKIELGATAQAFLDALR